MGAGQKMGKWGISREAEDSYLDQTLSVVKVNVENYGREVARMQEDIDEMLAHYHDNDVEVLTILNNTVTMHTHMKRALVRNEKAQSKPYFGRIIFHDEALDKEESIYIGKGGISRDTTHWMVVDWRAPVANAYYESNLGKCSYEAPGGVKMKIDLELKRTYEIEGGKLLDYFDSEVVANDDLLTKYLAKNKQAVLNEIVATIQKEQNEIIRKSPYHNIIVQGVAGSGKTTVAMHRISYILYNYTDRFRPDDFYIVGSNRILLDYITGVLPDLDVHGVRQMTMEQLFVRLLYEDWDEKKYRIRSLDKAGAAGSVKGGSGWFRDLEEYCRRLEWETISRESVFLNPRQFVEGFRNGKTGVFDEREGEDKNNGGRNLICLVEKEAVERYILQNPSVSIQNKIDMLNDRLMNKVKEVFLGKGISYTEAERKAITKAYRGRYGGREWKQSIYDMYRDFLDQQRGKGYTVDLPEAEFDVYDLAALAYLYARVKEKEIISEAHHVVIDEAQDFGMMAYHVLKFCIRGCTYTVMGDVSQNIHFGYGLNDWEELRGLLLPDAMDSFGILKKSYRNTVEISNFATDILHHGQFSTYPVEPIIRHGDPVRVQQLPERGALLRETAKVCKEWQKKGLDTIAVICRSGRVAKAVAEELGRYVDVMESSLETAVFGSGIMVLPVEYTKGLEFDAVLIFDPSREEYPVEDGHAKLLYVAATRALHELCVLHTGNLTGLIADSAPKREEAGQPVDLDAAADKGQRSEKTAMSETERLKQGIAQEKAPQTKMPQAKLPQKEAAVKPRIGMPTIKKPVVAGMRTPEHKKPFISQQIAGNGGQKAERPEAAALKAAVRKPIVSAKVRKPGSGYEFGDMPATEKLRPAGHSRIDLSVRWVEKRKDGVYLQSRYGILRLRPVSSMVIHVSFARDSQIKDIRYPGIRAGKTDGRWMYKSAGSTVELLTDALCLQVDKTSGAIRYMTRDKKTLLLAERSRECRQMEPGTDGRMKTWLYLDWPKGEVLQGIDLKERRPAALRGTARYISHGLDADRPPFLVSEKGYGIVMAAQSPVICCDIPAYGSYLHGESEEQMDYYFIAGKGEEEIRGNYTAYLEDGISSR